MVTARGAALDTPAQRHTSWVPIIVVVMAQVLLVFNVTALKVSIDALAETFGTSASSVKTAIVTYSLVVAALIMLGARLSQHFGARDVFRATLALFAAAMTAMAVSPGPLTMLLAQVAAGAAAAALVPTLAVLVAVNYSGDRQARAFGWLGAAQAIGIVPALLLAGFVATWVGWRYSFGLLVVLALATYALSAMLPEDVPRSPARIDIVGLVLAACAIFLIGAGCNNLNDWGAWVAKPSAPFSFLHLSPAPLVIIGGMLLVKAFLVWSSRFEARGGTPLIALDVFSSSQERSALVSIFLIGVIGAAMTFVIPLYIEVVQGRNSLYTAVAVSPFAFSSFAAAVFVARQRDRFHPSRTARYAFASVALGAVLLGATIHNDWSDTAVVLSMTAAGAGEGALATLLFKLLASRKRAGDVGPLCGTTDYLAAGVGTSLASALVIGVLAGSVHRELDLNPLIPDELKSQFDLDKVSFISNDQLRSKLARTTASADKVAEAVRINTEARLHSLQVCFFALAGLAVLALLPSASLPDYERETGGADAGEDPPKRPSR